jgi:phosphoglycerate dehydrogenase-like enzyme
MRTINHALITVDFKPENLRKILDALPDTETAVCKPNEKEKIARALKTADIAILASDLDDLILSGKKLRWIHCCHAGLNKSARREVFDRGILLTGSSGRSAPALAEHAMMFMLALTYDIPGLLAQQKNHIWGGLPGYSKRSSLYGKTVGIIGLGKTGSELAQRCQAFRMKVLGFRRGKEQVPGVDVMYSSENNDSLADLLRQSDYVVLCISLSDETYRLLGRDEFSIMKPSAYLINMARGSVVDEDVLIEFLSAGKIAGAGLDTTVTEPLPANSKLWDLPNVIITPHATPALPDREERSLSYVLQNIEAYRDEKPMANLLTPRDIYSHG